MFCSADDTCEKCMEGFELDGDDCVEIVDPVACPSDCDTCTVDNVCDECNDDEEKPTPIFGDCQPCEVEGCASCWRNGRCAACEEQGFMPNDDRDECVQCDVENCRKCEDDDEDECEFCNFGHRVSGGACEKR